MDVPRGGLLVCLSSLFLQCADLFQASPDPLGHRAAVLDQLLLQTLEVVPERHDRIALPDAEDDVGGLLFEDVDLLDVYKRQVQVS